MSIRERRPGVWQVRAYAGIDANGKARYAYKTFAGTKAEARREELRLKGSAGILPRGADRDAITLEQFAERWLTLYVVPRVVPRSVVIYRTALRRMILPALGHLRLRDITPEQIQRTFNDLPYAPSSKRKARTILGSCLKRARKSGLIDVNPCEDIILPPIRFKPARSLTADEARRFLQVTESCREGLLFAAALLTGLRKSELLMLRWDNVDLVKGIILVREGGSLEGQTKSAAGRRDVVLPRYLTDRLIAEHKADSARRAFTPAWNKGRYVFPSIHGEYRPGGNVPGRNLKKALGLAGIDLPGFRFHDLRHSHGSLLLMGGIPLPAIQERLGHASLQTTVQTYLHADGSGEAKAADYLDVIAGPGIVH